MGGCVSSRPEFPNSVHPNVFTVYPVTRPVSADAIESSSISGTAHFGNKNNATGQLEVTSTELILHRRGHEPVHWPLQYVRRYGYENHLFSFESGRRCESGPGIFTFRCRRAHELFLLVQANVQEARSPPAQPQGTGSLENAVATLERGRSGSMPSQFRFPGGRGQAVALSTPHASTEGSLTPRPAESMVPRALSAENAQIVAPSIQELKSGGTLDRNENEEATSVGDIFVEMVPAPVSLEKTQPLLQQRQRLSSARSQASSSAASDHSVSSLDKNSQSATTRRRPISFEFVLTPTLSSSQDGGDSSAFVSPRDEPIPGAATSPTTPPSTAYYVNVDPSTQGIRQQKLYQNKILTGLRKAPGRSQSLGSTSSNISDHHPHHYSDSTADDHAYINASATSESPLSSLISKKYHEEPINRSIPPDQPDPGTGPLDYVTIDVGRTAGTTSTGGRGTWTSSIPSSFYKRYHKRHASHTGWLSNGISNPDASTNVFGGRSLTSVAETGHHNHHVPRKFSNQERGNAMEAENVGMDSDFLNPASTSTSNYARIDCTRTKALRETAAAAQLQRRSTSCSASSTEAVEPPPRSSTGRRKHHDGPLSFGRRKHKSGSVDH